MRIISFMERNVHGAWVIYGAAGIRQYYYYTKAQARRLYIEHFHEHFVVEKG